MEKGDIVVLAQLLTAMKDATERLEIAYKKKNMEELASAKKEILELESRIDKLV